MQRIIQINIAGRLIPIEEDAYLMLKDYLTALERQFAGEEGNDEIISDIESRIAELFYIRLEAGAHSILRSDVTKVIDTLGPASELNDGNGMYQDKSMIPYVPAAKQKTSNQSYSKADYTRDRLYRNPNDKVLGGVCSGLAVYFDIDPVIIRLIFVVLFLTFGMGLFAYIIAWAVIPLARTPEELSYMTGGNPMTFHDITRNVHTELNDLKKRGEAMSRELKDFFGKKK
ncbi:MAG: PspC domain-containing protein [Flavipsychrobacter sp.]|nr:PspC domain-containing protein [Flavipsychrobacter sp.]